ncbi:unnamed protein product [Cyprideis torosa]|uniref:Ubiquitin carboxyl-terminal hydrolase n=1 Tax=Cyprideis torosa TaxID=163714 RepID=A0A7R8W7U2_9CRUS|nr:unnamed protein product [Cyprideis torosa]CAG0886728.1 unnamed protein product [Cyprideis torosa]
MPALVERPVAQKLDKIFRKNGTTFPEDWSPRRTKFFVSENDQASSLKERLQNGHSGVGVPEINFTKAKEQRPSYGQMRSHCTVLYPREDPQDQENRNGTNRTAHRIQSPSAKPKNAVNGHHPGSDRPRPKTILFPLEKVQVGPYRGPIGSGLINCGNTCYLNSSIQLLAHCSAMINWLTTDFEHRGNCVARQNNMFCALCAVYYTVLQIRNRNHMDATKPHHLTSQLKSIGKSLLPGQQEDAHEFLRLLISSMERCYLRFVMKLKQLDPLSKETTPVNQIFGGYMQSKVTCHGCNTHSNTYDHFQDLHLNVNGKHTLDEALRAYFRKEEIGLDECNKYSCDNCKRKCRAVKQFCIERPPNVLLICFKRFNMLGNKIGHQIAFTSTLDLQPYVNRCQNGQRHDYRLIGTVNHHGSSVNSGHYTANVLVGEKDWYHFDDTRVSKINTSEVIHNLSAYILLYERFQSYVEKETFATTPVNGPSSSHTSSSSESLTSESSRESDHFVTPIGPVLPKFQKINRGAVTSNQSTVASGSGGGLKSPTERSRITFDIGKASPKSPSVVFAKPLSQAPRLQPTSNGSKEASTSQLKRSPSPQQPTVSPPPPNKKPKMSNGTSSPSPPSKKEKTQLVPYELEDEDEDDENEGVKQILSDVPRLPNPMADQKGSPTISGLSKSKPTYRSLPQMKTNLDLSEHSPAKKETVVQSNGDDSDDDQNLIPTKAKTNRRPEPSKAPVTLNGMEARGYLLSSSSGGGLYDKNVTSWNGNRSLLNMESMAERRAQEQRQRDEGEWDEDMDRGKTKRVRARPEEGHAPDRNPIQEVHDHRYGKQRFNSDSPYPPGPGNLGPTFNKWKYNSSPKQRHYSDGGFGGGWRGGRRGCRRGGGGWRNGNGGFKNDRFHYYKEH